MMMFGGVCTVIMILTLPETYAPVILLKKVRAFFSLLAFILRTYGKNGIQAKALRKVRAFFSLLAFILRTYGKI
jgi:hypothetical protein